MVTIASIAYSESPESFQGDEIGLGAGEFDTIVSGVPNKRIKVIGAIFTSSQVTTIRFRSAEITPMTLFRIEMNSPFLLSPSAVGYGQTEIGEGLSISHTHNGMVNITCFVQFLLIA